MADFGAEVIKVEPTGEGDAYRNTSFQPGMPVADTNYCWTVDGRNKRSLALDLKRPEAQKILHLLIAEAEEFITNYPPPSRAGPPKPNPHFIHIKRSRTIPST